MRRRSKSEGGFALLLIFVLAAGIGIALMMQLPRYAFETARNREELLIERGEQYKRGLALYFRKTNRYPAKIEDLENTNNIRFLRRRYIDPMTRKDDWRIIHVGPGGILTDSLVKPTPTGNQKDGKTLSGQNFGVNPGNTVGGGTGTSTDPADTAVNAAVLHRPSDRPPPGFSNGAVAYDPNQPQAGFAQGQAYPGQPGFQPGQPGAGVPSQYPQPGQPQPGQPGYQPGYQQGSLQPGQPLFPGQPGYPQPGSPNYTGQPIYPGQAGYTPAQQGSAAGQPGYPQPGSPLFPGQPGYPQPGSPSYTGQAIYPGQPGYTQTNQGYNPLQNVPGVISGQPGGQAGLPQQQRKAPSMGTFPFGMGSFSASCDLGAQASRR